ncbi:MAG: hypothetical protein PHO41_09200 [Eubacteriales bacterium]|nr:hypothetical protein [Eubacteriales bacterium]
MKKRPVILAITVVFTIFQFYMPAYATHDEQEALTAFSPSVSAGAFLLAEATTLTPIAAENAEAKLPVAGLAKLPALLVLCEAMDISQITPEQEVTVSREAASVGGPTAFIETNETIAASELIKAACMICAGDAMYALGEALTGSGSAFLERINTRMALMDKSVTLTDPMGNGLTLSAKNLVQLGQSLNASKTFRAHAGMTLETILHADGRETELVNANKLLRGYAGCTGIATGSSQQDGYMGLFYVTRGDTSMFCAVVSCKNSSERFSMAAELLDYAFTAVKATVLATEGQVMVENIKVSGGMRREVNLIAKEGVTVILEQTAGELVEKRELPEALTAPLSATDTVGKIMYETAEGKQLAVVELIPQYEVETAGFRDRIREVLLMYLRN